MATRRIPVRNGREAYRMSVELDGDTYEFLFRWNARDAHWYMDISIGGTRQVAGVKVVESEDLLATADYRSVPQGVLRVVDVTGAGRDPDIETFGDDVVVYYDEVS